MRKLAILTAAALLLAPAASHAQVVLGARLGVAVGMGDVGGGYGDSLAMSDWTRGQVPLQLEMLFKATPQLAIGPYFSYGWARLGHDLESQVCDVPGIACSASIVRLGVEALYTIPQRGQFEPWLGFGLGYEWSKLHASGAGVSGEIKFSGLEFLNLQVGGDFKVSRRFGLGPFMKLAFARYSNADATGDFSGMGPTDIPDEKVHEWLEIGVRGAFDL
jgi:hypothetical protein